MSAREAAISVVRILQEAGHIAYFAGGWVRDFLMKRPSDDIDIATSASVSEVQALFDKTIPVGVAFGIVIVVHKGFQFEVATFRKDRGYTDGRRPTGIERATPEEDAERRDFTINGMFYDPIQQKLYDYIGGSEDIQRGVIRAIGNPHERFAEDRLRMMRAVRYSTRFNFPIEEETKRAILAHASELLPAVAMERVWQEFKKMAQFAHFDSGLIALHKLNLLPTIFPELKGVSEKEIAQRVQYIEQFPPDAPPFASVLELFPGYSLEQIELLADALKLSNQERAFAAFYHKAGALLAMPAEWRAKLEKIEWATFYSDPDCEVCLNMIAARSRDKGFLQEHTRRRKELAGAIERIRLKKPYLTADDLLACGVKPGVKMGQLLKEAMRIAVNEGIEDKSVLLHKLKLWN